MRVVVDCISDYRNHVALNYFFRLRRQNWIRTDLATTDSFLSFLCKFDIGIRSIHSLGKACEKRLKVVQAKEKGNFSLFGRNDSFWNSTYIS